MHSAECPKYLPLPVNLKSQPMIFEVDEVRTMKVDAILILGVASADRRGNIAMMPL